jgi:hypothetical protein
VYHYMGVRDMSEYSDPVFLDEDGFWYFYDETWARPYGPFETEKECREAFKIYCENML